ncbi:hypothetical protein DAEQUDRAFT_724619 [Daedalea quercina L-15889]|uniref:Uncharacterized protein n=1 Tax=Daedalea quercina L-15889 TaxID=1314783 RepID=A0A165RW57_9APHY|nr:hypothetical protein DAEQUDRAFT_724619 [Daedalea quercina L-15889]
MVPAPLAVAFLSRIGSSVALPGCGHVVASPSNAAIALPRPAPKAGQRKGGSPATSVEVESSADRSRGPPARGKSG